MVSRYFKEQLFIFLNPITQRQIERKKILNSALSFLQNTHMVNVLTQARGAQHHYIQALCILAVNEAISYKYYRF